MTCVVGVSDQGKVWFGADSAAIHPRTMDLVVRRDPKVFQLGAFTVGFCDSFRQGQLVRLGFTPPKHPRGVTVERYMVTTFVDALRRCLLDGGVLSKKDNVEESDGDILVGYRGRLFEIASDFQCGEPAYPFAAIGCGAPIALGALHVTKKMPPRQRVIAALNAAQAFSGGVRAPFNIIEPR